MLPETDGEVATRVANEILKRLKRAQLKKYVGAEASRSSNYRDGFTSQNLTASMGIASATKEHNMYDTIRTADAAMYQAKSLGKDRVFSAYQKELLPPIP